MQQEIEAKFVSVDHENLRDKLKSTGANCTHPMRLMTRVVMDYPDQRLQKERNGWVRIRDEGDKVTCTYKEAEEGQFGAAREIEFTVGSYEKAIEMFKALGLATQSEQQSKRETWEYQGVQIVLDEWPWLEPFVEIEGPDEASVYRVSEALGFAWDKAVFGTVISLYRQAYPAIQSDAQVAAIASISFDHEKPDWFTAQ